MVEVSLELSCNGFSTGPLRGRLEMGLYLATLSGSRVGFLRRGVIGRGVGGGCPDSVDFCFKSP